MTNYSDISAVVVLYHPDIAVLENLAPIIEQVAALYVVDNSETPEPLVSTQLAAYRNVSVIHRDGNIGIASALNRAAEHALSRGCSFLLTLDQDSRPLPGMIAELVACHGSGVGIVAPYLVRGPDRGFPTGSACQPVLTAMTSGSLLNLAAYKKAGPFRDDFFIDFVDIEYCLRLHSAGYTVLVAGNALLEHHVGTRIALGGRLNVTSHPVVRKYYKTRNRLLVWREYGAVFPGYIWRDRCRFVLELVRLLLFEPEKGAKLGMIRRGWLDYTKGRFGKYEQ